jgi:hypothetical protein
MLSKTGDGMVLGLILAIPGFLLGVGIVITIGIMMPVLILQWLSAWIS